MHISDITTYYEVLQTSINTGHTSRIRLERIKMIDIVHSLSWSTWPHQ